MTFPDHNWNRYNEGSSRQASSKSSMFSMQGGEEPSFSNNNVSNPHLNKTLTKLIDRFNIIHHDQSQQEIIRQKERLLESYSNTLLRYAHTR
jgi:hypothetical protein